MNFNLNVAILALGFELLPWYGNLLIGVWLWAFGANVGSFMNVVVFRLPAGKSVVSPRSRCPSCGSAIAWYDNIPVLSWLWLRARCRSCGTSISSRYPTVEAIVAAVFVLLAFLGPVTMGDDLHRLLLAPPWRPQTMESLWLMYAYHLLMLCTLLCVSLIAYDRQRSPFRLFLPALCIGWAAPLIWPQLHPVPFAAPVALNERWVAVIDGAAGIAVGGALALIHMLPRWGEMAKRMRGQLLAAALVGLFLGWQAAAASLVAAEVLWGVALRLSGPAERLRRIPWTAYLTASALIYVILWPTVYETVPWLGSASSIATFTVSAFAVALIGWFTSGLEPEMSSDRMTATRGDQEHLTSLDGAHQSMNDREQLPGDLTALEAERTAAILESQSYRLAELDTEFLARPELRPIRLQLELLKPEMILTENNVVSTIVAFGGTQIVEREEAERRLEVARAALAEKPTDPARQRIVDRALRVLAKSKYYDAARAFGRLVSSHCHVDGRCDYVIVTGGGPGIMEAANRGAADVNAKSMGLNITLPDEQAPNPYITPELCFQFHYFALRKMHFLFRAKALVAFPGGFGTLDELFDALTLRQTQRMQEIPIILYGREYWDRVIDFQFLADEGTIRDEHLDLIQYAETPEQAWEIIAAFHGVQAAANPARP